MATGNRTSHYRRFKWLVVSLSRRVVREKQTKERKTCMWAKLFNKPSILLIMDNRFRIKIFINICKIFSYICWGNKTKKGTKYYSQMFSRWTIVGGSRYFGSSLRSAWESWSHANDFEIVWFKLFELGWYGFPSLAPKWEKEDFNLYFISWMPVQCKS